MGKNYEWSLSKKLGNISLSNTHTYREICFWQKLGLQNIYIYILEPRGNDATYSPRAGGENTTPM